jgi:hypothetical protein
MDFIFISNDQACFTLGHVTDRLSLNVGKRNYQSKLRNIPEERRPHLQDAGSLKMRIYFNYLLIIIIIIIIINCSIVRATAVRISCLEGIQQNVGCCAPNGDDNCSSPMEMFLMSSPYIRIIFLCSKIIVVTLQGFMMECHNLQIVFARDHK